VSYSGETLESPMWSVRVIPIDCRGTGECRKVGDHPRGPLSLGGTPVALNGRLQMFTDDPLSGVAYAVTTRARSAVGVTARLLLTCWRRELSIVTDSLPTAGLVGLGRLLRRGCLSGPAATSICLVVVSLRPK
jgi:hypothetical protein